VHSSRQPLDGVVERSPPRQPSWRRILRIGLKPLRWRRSWKLSVDRGEVFRLPSPRRPRGHEQRGPRYGVVLQADELLALSTVIIAPTSTRALPASFRPEVQVKGKTTRVLVEQFGAVDRSRLGRSQGHLKRAELDEVDRALALVLGLA
jgi:mRNA interferase MazF